MKRALPFVAAAFLATGALAQQSFDLPSPKPKPAPVPPAFSPVPPAATPAPTRTKPTFTPAKPAAAESAARHYRNGEFPRGTIYRASDLGRTADKKLSRPAYLTGKLLYLGRQGGVHLFTTFAIVPNAFLPSWRGPHAGAADMANPVIEVIFPDNFPRGLSPGQIIVPNDQCPLTLQSVRRAADGKVYAQALSEAVP